MGGVKALKCVREIFSSNRRRTQAPFVPPLQSARRENRVTLYHVNEFRWFFIVCKRYWELMCAQGSRRERGLWTFSVGGRSTAFFWNLITLSQMQICDFLYSILVLPQKNLSPLQRPFPAALTYCSISYREPLWRDKTTGLNFLFQSPILIFRSTMAKKITVFGTTHICFAIMINFPLPG